ncbi:DUF6452 family protein [Nonlabens xiamenensis]|uniref:DUF6452 family protein n=1 Tax=Nonlabens xiamenensis TaxID=2341043 RepID=UPI000F612C9D|nr:DUF6452 family protein [Nonlabens xiamenensis]
MSKESFWVLVIFFFAGISSCEKDDLCTPDQAVTPRLIIQFKDQFNPLMAKAVPSLQVREIGATDFAPLNDSGATMLSEVDSIAIPLRTNDQLTSYDFLRREDGNLDTDNIDFTYELNEEYVSRACGFRVVYENLNGILNNSTWISSVVVVEPQVTNNTDIHVEIRH